MKKIALITTISVALAGSAFAATYAGNGQSGFGGVLGTGNLALTDNGTTLSITFTKGSSNFNDSLVIYFDSKAGGLASLPSFGEAGSPDYGRRSVVNEYGSGIDSFGPSFGADFAFVLSPNKTRALYELNSVNPNLLNVPQIPTVSNFTSVTAATYSFDLTIANLGITPNSGASFKFVATYLNPVDGAGSDATFRSNEAIGYSSGTNPGYTGISFTSSQAYTTVPEPATWALLAGGLTTVMVFRRRRNG